MKTWRIWKTEIHKMEKEKMHEPISPAPKNVECNHISMKGRLKAANIFIHISVFISVSHTFHNLIPLFMSFLLLF